jgi:hypothetical protein
MDGWEEINPCTVRYLAGVGISRFGIDGLFLFANTYTPFLLPLFLLAFRHFNPLLSLLFLYTTHLKDW